MKPLEKQRIAEGVPPINATPNAAPRGHLDYIDGFRGLAILFVLLFHIWQYSHSPAAYWWNPLYSGYAGVNLFLLLSGFCLYWPLVKPNKPSPEPTLAAFAGRRAHRLLPPYYFTLILFTLAALLAQARGLHFPDVPEESALAILKDAGWHALMLHNLRPNYLWTIDGPFWSLALEVNLYIAMPILVVVARRWRIEWAVALAALVTLTYRFWAAYFVGGHAGWGGIAAVDSFTLCSFLPGRWVEFALGMWAASLVARGVSDKRRASFGVSSLAFLLLAAWLHQRYGEHNPFSDMLFGLGFFFLVLQAARKPGEAWVSADTVGKVFRVRPLVWLGQISYSVYLLHQPLLKLANDAALPYLKRDRELFALNLFVTLPLVIGIAYFFYLKVERRFINAARDQAAKPAPRQTSSEAAALGVSHSTASEPPGRSVL